MPRTLRLAARLLERSLAVAGILMIVVLAVLVIAAVVMRYAGSPIVWYDEVASTLLAELTYVGMAFAMIRRAHLGFGTVLMALPLAARRVGFLLSECTVLAVLAAVAWCGWSVLGFFGGDTLVSVPWMPRAVVQACVPICAVLAMAAQIVSVPHAWHLIDAGLDPDRAEIEHEIERASRGSGARREQSA